jgi:hypothetical protein
MNKKRDWIYVSQKIDQDKSATKRKENMINLLKKFIKGCINAKPLS